MAWFLSSKAPLFDLEGQVVGLAGLLYPIATPEHQHTHFPAGEKVPATWPAPFLPLDRPSGGHWQIVARLSES